MQYFFTKLLASTERATTFAFRMKSLAITPYQTFEGIFFIMALCFASSCQIIVLSGAARYAINEFSENTSLVIIKSYSVRCCFTYQYVSGINGKQCCMQTFWHLHSHHSTSNGYVSLFVGLNGSPPTSVTE